MPSTLDKSLDEIIESSWEDGRGRGKGGGRGKGKTRGWNDDKQNGSAKSRFLDMSLDEVVDTRSGGRKGKGFGKARDRSPDWGDSRRGGGKGFGDGSRRAPSGPVPYWMEHDDRDMDDDAPVGKGKGWSKGGKSWDGKGAAWWPEPSYKGYGGEWDFYGKGAPKGRWPEPSYGFDEPDSFGKGLTLAGRSSGMARRVSDAGPEPRPVRTSAPEYRAPARTAEKRGRRIDDDDDESEEVKPPPKARARTTASATVADKSSGPKTVKVTNIPRDLKAADVREAFEGETGKVTLCELSKGTAMITFAKAKDAQKAVEVFDRGELNGKTISVTLHK